MAKGAFVFAIAALLSACNAQTQKAKQLIVSCDKGDAKACNDVANRFQDGRYVLRDPVRAAELFDKSCKSGLGDGCASLGVIKLTSRREGNAARNLKPDTASAIALFRKGCDTGGMKGCVRLGTFYRKGITLARDDSAAAALFKKACDAHELVGCSNLASLYATGEGVAQNFDTARNLAQQSCDAKVKLGCVELGKLYSAGTGLTQNDSIAATLFKKSCIGNNPEEPEFVWFSDDRELEGCFRYGMSLELGKGIGQDYIRALMVYREGCEASHAEACFRGGELYEKGAGAYHRPERAAEMLKKSCDLGYPPACNKPKSAPRT